jgi:hypothetical protein
MDVVQVSFKKGWSSPLGDMNAKRIQGDFVFLLLFGSAEADVGKAWTGKGTEIK